MKWFLSIPILFVAVLVWQWFNPAPDALAQILTKEKACEAQAQTAFKMDWCRAQATDAIGDLQKAEGRK